jgi:hypothetical protein
MGGTDCTASFDSGCIALRVEIEPWTSTTTDGTGPIEADANWKVTNSTGQHLSHAYMLLVSSAGAITGEEALVGIDPDPDDDYLIVELDGLYAATIYLGPLAPGESGDVTVHYRVADDLEFVDGEYVLPQLLIQAAVLPVPEPGALSLFAVGLVGIAAWRRRQ